MSQRQFIHRIMFVCHGNICRSTMAEFVMRDMVARAGLGDRIAIASCATAMTRIRVRSGCSTRTALPTHAGPP